LRTISISWVKKMGKVIIRKITTLKETIGSCLDELGFKPKYREIILKPNVLSYLKSGSGFITDVKVVRALIQALLERYEIDRIFVAESSYINADTKKSFAAAGYYALEKLSPKVTLVDLKDAEYEDGNFNVRIPKILKDKTLIDMPVLKGHPQTGLTCALKNLKGLLHDSDKRNIHKWGLEEHLPLLANFKVELVIVDATTVRETFGKPFPRKFSFNRIIAGFDPAEVDKAACLLTGIDVDTIKYLKTVLEGKNEETELIGFSGPLAKWKPVVRLLKIGKYGINITSSCSRCWDNCLEAIRPGHIKRETSIINDVLTVLNSFLLPENVNLIVGSHKELIGAQDGKVVLCGDCAVNKLGIKNAIEVRGCPPTAEAIRKALKEKHTDRKS